MTTATAASKRRKRVPSARTEVSKPARVKGFKSLVYGKSANQLLFIPERRAQYLAKVKAAIFGAKTWAELERLAPRKAYREIRRGNRESGQLEPHEMRGDARFDWETMTDVYDGDYPGWPAQEMLDWMPADIQRDFGRVTSSAISGFCLLLELEDEEAILQQLKHAGFRCRRDDVLVEGAG
jgi:hypothetical protein